MVGQAVLVTGASSGIGRATAVYLSELGARVVVLARNARGLEETLGRMQGTNHRAEVMDLNETDSIPARVRKIAEEVAPLRGIVHCAGIQQTLGLSMANAARIDAAMHINVSSAMMLIKGFRQKGCATPGGSVVLISSVAGLAGQPGISIYSATKAALIGLAKSAAIELAREGLRVNCVAPGYVETEMARRVRETLTPEQFEAIQRRHPLGIGSPVDVAGAVAFLLAETGKWITGTTLVVDGGYVAC